MGSIFTKYEVRSIIMPHYYRSENATKFHSVPHENEDRFVEPVQSIDKSGGTASLVLIRSTSNSNRLKYNQETYVGKESTHAMHEVLFYERVRSFSERGEPGWSVFEFMLQYEGIFSLLTKFADNRAEVKPYIVIENLMDGLLAPRLIDIKLGAFTTDKYWNGKSRFAAWRGRQIDKMTNSDREGYRMEGMDNPPLSLSSVTSRISNWKRARRLIYQRHTAHEFFTYFFDLQHMATSFDISVALHPIELASSIHLSLIEQLSHVMWYLKVVPVPQKWVGSSLVVCYDTYCPQTDAECLRVSKIKIKLLDWGRSELTSMDDWKTFTPGSRANRIKFWNLYINSLLRLLYETINLYYRLYCAENTSIEKFRIEVFDRDLLDKDDFIGYVQVPISSSEYIDCPLLNRDNIAVRDEFGQLSTVKLSWRVIFIPKSLNQPLSSYMKLHIVSGKNLPRMDLVGKGGCDPFACIINSSGAQVGRTMVCSNTRNPEWNSWTSISNFDKIVQMSKLTEAFCKGSSGRITQNNSNPHMWNHIFSSESHGNQTISMELFRRLFDIPEMETDN